MTEHELDRVKAMAREMAEALDRVIEPEFEPIEMFRTRQMQKRALTRWREYEGKQTPPPVQP